MNAIHHAHIRFLLMVCVLLCGAVSMLPAQETPRLYALPRVGSHLDSDDVEYFQLFPDITGYRTSVLGSIFRGLRDYLPGRWCSAEADVTSGPDDSVRFIRTTGEDGLTDSRTISAGAATVLGIYLERFEEIRVRMSMFEFPYSDLIPDSLRDAADELFDADILPSSWPEHFQHDAPSHVRITQRDGMHLDGYVLGLTTRHLLLWTAGPVFDPDSVETALRVVTNEHIDTLIVEGSESATTLLGALFNSVIWVSQASIGTTNDNNATDPQGLAIMLVLTTPLAGALGAAASVSHDYALQWNPDAAERFESSPLYESMMVRPGLPPEVRSTVPLNAGERVYLRPEDHIPIVKNPNQALPEDAGYWSAGYEQLWLSANDLLGLRPGLTAGYDYEYVHTADRIFGLGIRTQVSGGAAHAAAGVQATARLGPWQVVAGFRGMWMPEELAVSTTIPSTGISRDPTTTTTTQHAERAGQFLYSELGAEIVIWDVVFGMHILRQLSPSATEHSVTTLTRRENETYETSRHDLRLGAFVLSMRLRF